jgi:hypothetical protein
MCTVKNGIPDVKGSINQTGVTSINVKGIYYLSTHVFILSYVRFAYPVAVFSLTNLERRTSVLLV